MGNRKHSPQTITHTKIHIFGAAGTGTTTLGKLLAEKLRADHVDVDDLTWDHTSRQFDRRLPRATRKARLKAEIATKDAIVLSGSLCGWGDELVSAFSAGIFLQVPTSERLKRIAQREIERYGAEAIAAGGANYDRHQAFMTWAGLYDYNGSTVRSYGQHRQWMRKIRFPILTIKGAAPLDTVMNVALTYLLSGHQKDHRMTHELIVDGSAHRR